MEKLDGARRTPDVPAPGGMAAPVTMVRWGILSTASIATEKVIPGIRRSSRGEVVAIGSRDAERARAAADRHGIAHVHGSYEALLADPDVDAVYVPLPNHLHAEWTLAAARAGKHVLCEKPLALTAADAERMIEGCRAEGVVLMEAFMYRLHPSWVAARELVAAGRIGRLAAVSSWFSYYNDDPANIRNVRAYGGGALLDIGCYSVNLSRMLFGAEPTRVEASVVRDPASGVDVLTSGLLEFADGVATFTCSTRTEPDQQVHLYGTEGRISIPIPFNIPPDRPTQVHLTAGGDPPVAPATETLTFEPADPYAVEADRFAASILDGEAVPTPAEDAVANLRVIERLFAAAERNGVAPGR
jgi:predicted dehydrogenase